MRILRTAAVAALMLLAGACSSASGPDGLPARMPVAPSGGWVYQLQGYPAGRLDELARVPQSIAVIDLARDAHGDYFRPDEIAALQATGKLVLAYVEIGSIEEFRPEYAGLRAEHPDLILKASAGSPNEYFVAYWEPRWWELVLRPRVDQSLRAGFDGVYLDTPLAHEEVELLLAHGRDREGLGVAMVDLIIRMSEYAKAQNRAMRIVPQNSPELRHYPGYTAAIDGIGIEGLFVRATNEPCIQDYCTQKLAETRALRDAGKVVLAVDYAESEELIASTCARYRAERFTGYIGVRELDRAHASCG